MTRIPAWKRWIRANFALAVITTFVYAPVVLADLRNHPERYPARYSGAASRSPDHAYVVATLVGALLLELAVGWMLLRREEPIARVLAALMAFWLLYQTTIELLLRSVQVPGSSSFTLVIAYLGLSHAAYAFFGSRRTYFT